MTNNPTTEADVIDPRTGEDFDTTRLADFLKDKLPGGERAMELRQFSGGHANLTYLLTFGDREFVLRRPPLGPIPPLAHDMAREYRVLTALNKSYPPAPTTYVFSDDTSIIGAPFFVMERRQGVVVRKTIPDVFGGGKDARVNRILSEVMIKALAGLHRVNYEEIGLGDLGKAAGFMKRQVRIWAQAYHRSKTEEIATAPVVIDWLKANLPEQYNGAIIHNDWRLDNIMVAEEDPGRLVAVFDWDMCTIGEPLADLGTLLSTWNEADEVFGDGSLPEVMPSRVPGFLTRDEAVELYGRETGFDVSRMSYFRVFGLFKMAIVAQQIYLRFQNGQTQDERFAVFGKACKTMIEKAAELIG